MNKCTEAFAVLIPMRILILRKKRSVRECDLQGKVVQVDIEFEKVASVGKGFIIWRPVSYTFYLSR